MEDEKIERYQGSFETAGDLSGAVMGSTAIAEAIKKKINEVLRAALSGSDPKYRTNEGFIRWGLVERDMRDAVDMELR